MSIHPDSADVPIAEHAPWMPLEGVIEQWAAFAQAATTPQMSKAVSAAFAALSHEQEALQSYHLADQADPCHVLACPSVLSSYELTLDELQQGARAWMRVAYVLEREVRSVSAGTDRLAPLVLEALTHCQRLSCLAHAVLAEQQRRYQQQHEAGTAL